jgi:3-oxoacyl-[acyl-carrier-protein] synthase III
MSLAAISGWRIAGISTCVPARSIDNQECGATFGEEEVRKVVAMAGVQHRHVVDPGTTAADLCFEAAQCGDRLSHLCTMALDEGRK